MRSSTQQPGRFSYVYDGRTCLGHIISRGVAGYEAFDSSDTSLGLFDTQRGAAAALSDRGRQ